MAAPEPCPATRPLCWCGIRGCDKHEPWAVVEIDWRRPRKKRKRGR